MCIRDSRVDIDMVETVGLEHMPKSCHRGDGVSDIGDGCAVIGHYAILAL
jgi:hypothetical protein